MYVLRAINHKTGHLDLAHECKNTHRCHAAVYQTLPQPPPHSRRPRRGLHSRRCSGACRARCRAGSDTRRARHTNTHALQRGCHAAGTSGNLDDGAGGGVKVRRGHRDLFVGEVVHDVGFAKEGVAEQDVGEAARGGEVGHGEDARALRNGSGRGFGEQGEVDDGGGGDEGAHGDGDADAREAEVDGRGGVGQPTVAQGDRQARGGDELERLHDVVVDVAGDGDDGGPGVEQSSPGEGGGVGGEGHVGSAGRERDGCHVDVQLVDNSASVAGHEG